MNLVTLFITSLITQNIILIKFLGLCPLLGASNEDNALLKLGLSVMIVTVLSSIINYYIYYYILVPFNSEYFKTMVFILVIAFLVQILTLIIKAKFNKLYKLLGLYLPLITTNCAVLGTVLINVSNDYTLVEVLINSLGSSLGFILATYIFANLREQINTNKKDIPFSTYSIMFITAGIMALLFSSFGGG